MNASWMMMAVEEARKGEGHTAPNPPVGAVLVREGQCIGRGYHPAAGLPHAEVEAFEACRQQSPGAPFPAEGATLYVTLEPCSTQGRTPPCTERIIREKVACVVIGVVDPNPRHAGRGVAILQKAGIEVIVLNDTACVDLIAPFRCWITIGRPFMTLKIARTADGFIGREGERGCEPVRISCEESWKRVHALRQRVDAIMAGVGTVVADNPRLTVRLADDEAQEFRSSGVQESRISVNSPPAEGCPTGGVVSGYQAFRSLPPSPYPLTPTSRWRVIVDSHGRTPLTANVCTDATKACTVIAVTEACPESRRKDFTAAGVTVWVLPSDTQGRVDMNALCEKMGTMQWLHVLCEGGATLAASLLRGGHVDALHLITAPWTMETGVRAFNGFDIETAFQWRDPFPVGTDLWRIGLRIPLTPSP